MLMALSLLPFHCTRNIALAPAIKFVSCIKVLQSCDAVMDIHHFQGSRELLQAHEKSVR